MFLTSTLAQVGWQGWWVPAGWGLLLSAIIVAVIWLAVDFFGE